MSETVFKNDATANAAAMGIYSDMIASGIGFFNGGASSIATLTALASDELNYSVLNDVFFRNSITADHGTISSNWSVCYNYIYQANAILEGMMHSTEVSQLVRNQVEGEARFFRAFYYFYLTSMWGDVPIVLTTDYRNNANVSRSGQLMVFSQIIEDLNKAKLLLSEDYAFSAGEKVRLNKFCASAMLARIYLYVGDWAKSETEASDVIAQANVYALEPDLNKVFLKNSSEAIWQLSPSSQGRTWDTNEGLAFIPHPVLLSRDNVFYTLSPELLNSFEPGDNRRVKWIENFVSGTGKIYSVPYKYKVRSKNVSDPITEYSMVLRLAEQYLIRSEARLNQLNIDGAKDDINIIRKRAGLGNISVNTQPDLLSAIVRERRAEFFVEYGHRWLDLKRWDRIDNVLGNVKGPNWAASDALWPIPQSELIANPRMTQNSGY